MAKTLAATVSVETALEFRLPVPNSLLPAENVTVPEGMVAPLAAFTVTDRTVEPVVVMEAGVALRIEVVEMSGTVTVTVAEAVAPAKLPVGA